MDVNDNQGTQYLALQAAELPPDLVHNLHGHDKGQGRDNLALTYC
jgi:hypothetical protein